MRSGRRFSYGLQAADPTRLLAALADRGIAAAGAAARHPILAYAHAHASVTPWRWHHRLAKFVLFALVPTAVWFNAHQHIAYGGLLGQYYLEGLRAYLTTFLVSWSLAIIYLLLYASLWRGVAETVAFVAAWLAPARAVTARRAVEVACRLVYYVGVPVLLGAAGVEKIIEVELTPDEHAALQRSAAAVEELVHALPPLEAVRA